MPRDLFSDSGDGTAAPSLRVNASFARSYEDRKRRQDLGRARELGLSSAPAGGDDESSMSEDDTGEALDAKTESRIRETIRAIRARDPRCYEPTSHFFAADDAAGDADDGAAAPPEKKRKPKSARDTLRAQLVEAAEAGRTDAFESDDDDGAVAAAGGGGAAGARARALSTRAYDDEQRALRAAFLETAAAAVEGAGAGVDGGGGGTGGSGGASRVGGDDDALLRVKPQTAAARAAEEAAAEEDRERLLAAMRTQRGGIALHASDIADPDAFLSTFLESSAWKVTEFDARAEDEAGSGGEDGDIAVVDDEIDEEEVEKAEAFEAQYNFRFEDPSGAAIVTHARTGTAADSLRRKDTSRKDERARKAERKASMRKEADEETRRLMNLKRDELASRVGRIQEIAGVDATRIAAALGGADALDADFDPAAHDAAMAALFGDDFYGEDEADIGGGEDGDAARAKGKAAKWVWGDGPRPAWAGPTAEALADGVDDLGITVGGGSGGGDGGGDGEDDLGEGNAYGEHDDDALADEAHVGSRRARKAGKRARAANKRVGAVARARAAMEADRARAGRTLAGGLGRADDPDEVLALGFEDVIADGLRTRFKYTSVPADDFGLTTEELLLADDSELTAYVGLRRIAPYREVPWQVKSSKRKKAVAQIQSAIAARLEASGALKPNVVGGGGGKRAGEEEGAAGSDRDDDAPALEDVTDDVGKPSNRRRKHKRSRGTGADGDDGSAGARGIEAPAPTAADGDDADETLKKQRRKEAKKARKREASAAEIDAAARKAARAASYGF